MAHILHITADYPDPLRGRTTPAVLNLIRATPHHRHTVVSITRTTNPFRTFLRDCGFIDGVRVLALRYHGLPLSVGLNSAMHRVAAQISEFLRSVDMTFDVIHAHKLCFEGIAGLDLSEHLGLPLVCSVRGEADRKVLVYTPWRRSLIRRVIKRASHIYLVSAWMERQLIQLCPRDHCATMELLPNLVSTPLHGTPQPIDNGRVLCIADLNVYRKKGIPTLMRALQCAALRGEPFFLDLVGWTSPRSTSAIIRIARRLGVREYVTIKGQRTAQEVQDLLPHYSLMALPSQNETFGMSYIEALLAGVPVLYSSDTGIDGYLDGITSAIRVNPRDYSGISQLISGALRSSTTLRRRLFEQRHAVVARFDGAAVAKRYSDTIAAIAAEAHSLAV